MHQPIEIAGDSRLEVGPTAKPWASGEITTQLVTGEKRLRTFIPAILELRTRCGQEHDFATHPEHFIAANTIGNRRVMAIVFHCTHRLEACVYFVEHCRFGISLGLARGGDAVGESLIAAPETLRLHYVNRATRLILDHKRFFGVSLAIKAPMDQCIEHMGPQSKHRLFKSRSVQHCLPLQETYEKMLASVGPGTRRSLKRSRMRLESRANLAFVDSLEPSRAFKAMLMLMPRSKPERPAKFYETRYALLRKYPNLFCMGMHLPDGTWLSLILGWRQNEITHVDLQMNDLRFKNESLSVTMRSFLLEHEIARKQQFINFVGGTTLRLRKYCQPVETCTDVVLWRPSLRAIVFQTAVPRVRPVSVYAEVKEPSVENTDLV